MTITGAQQNLRTRVCNALFVDHAQGLGGAEHSLLDLLAHIDRSRVNPVLACNAGSLERAARSLGVRVEIVEMPQLSGQGIRALGSLVRGVRRIQMLVGELGTDVVHSNVMRASFYAAGAALVTHRPLVWHVRDILKPGWYTGLMARLAKRTIAISQACAEPLPRRCAAEIIPNGVQIDRYAGDVDSGRFRQEFDLARDAPLVTLVGRLRPWKGQEDFLEAMAPVHRQSPDARFAVVGGSPLGDTAAYRQEIERLAGEYGLAKAVVFTGHRADLPAIFAASDVVVHCSAEPEPFGRVIIEAMAAGRPVVAYAHGGPTEIIVDGETGVLVPPRDIAALAATVAGLLENPKRARSLGMRGRVRAAQQYNSHQVARRVEDVLLSVCAQTGAAP